MASALAAYEVKWRDICDKLSPSISLYRYRRARLRHLLRLACWRM